VGSLIEWLIFFTVEQEYASQGGEGTSSDRRPSALPPQQI